MDEHGKDQKRGEIVSPDGGVTQAGCKRWCLKMEMATGCEYIINKRKCVVHTWRINEKYADGDENVRCFGIQPGLLLFVHKLRKHVNVIKFYENKHKICAKLCKLNKIKQM